MKEHSFSISTIDLGSSLLMNKLLLDARALGHHVEEQRASRDKETLFVNNLTQRLCRIHLVDTGCLAILVVHINTDGTVGIRFVHWQRLGKECVKAI